MTDPIQVLNPRERESIWEQKYRPDALDQVVLPDELRAKYESYLAEEVLPNLCLYSPSPGTGKTTSALVLAAEYGCRKPLLINASLDTSIDTIRTKVYQYATGTSLAGGRKVVVLDEVERLSSAAQESLKGLIEAVSKNCSFILTTNAASSINGPLLSRCRLNKFMWNDEEALQMQKQMMKRAIAILEAESIEYHPQTIAALVKQCFPDNRTLLGTLQDYAVSRGAIDEGVLRNVQTQGIGTLIEHMRNKKFFEVKQWVYENSTRLGPDFYPKLIRVLCGDNGAEPLIEGKGQVEAIEFLGEEQKYHGHADLWLHVLRVTTVLMQICGPHWIKK